MHPFELEWMEGATAVHVLRLLEGMPLYVRPSVDFVPFAYPPLYYYLSLPFAWITQDVLLSARIISVCATAGTMVALFMMMRRDSGVVGGIVSAGAYAGAYALSDGWFDLGRVDALYIYLLSLVCLTASRATTTRTWMIAGALTCLAFFTKQPAVLVVVPLLGLLLVQDRRAAVAFGATVAIGCGLGVVVLHLATDGWYSYYVFEIPRMRVGVSSRLERLWLFWTTDMAPFAIALLGGAVVIWKTRAWRHAALIGGLIGSAWMARLEGGSWNNAAMPAYLAAAIMLGFLLREPSGRLSARTVLAALQVTVLLYDPRRFIPSLEQATAAKTFEQTLQSSGAPVWVFDHALWATRAGQREFAHGWAVTDVVWADRGPVGRALDEEIRRAIADKRFAGIVLDRGRSWFRQDVERHYRPAARALGPVPVSGARRSPEVLFSPR